MYQALKTAQNDIHSVLLKFSDDLVQVSENRAAPTSAAVATSAAVPTSVQCTLDPAIQHAIELIHAKQDNQFRILSSALDTLNQNMARIATILIDQSVTTSTVIPSLQPVGTTDELKNIGIVPSYTLELDESVVEEVDEDEVVEHEVEEEEVEEVEEEVEEEESAQQEEEVEEEEGVEVEEWTYKGRVLFKDSDNTVYANDSGEIGDPIGTYDPVKNILKKLAA